MFVSELSTMWPMLPDMTRDDCRRTLRRLELEAYSSMISVFRAQGALADDRKKLLEDLRGALNISNDRHTAEARRVSNDELLATIASQLSGPNTELGWVCEGRRKVPILPRSIPQTMYTELADQAAIIASKENEKIALKRLANDGGEKLQDQEIDENAEGGVQDMEVDETCSPAQDKVDNIHRPLIVMYDNSDQLAMEEAPPPKRSRQDVPMSPTNSPSAASTPAHPKPNHQRYLNISQIYSNYSKTPPTAKVKQPERNYNQSGKGQGKGPHGPKSMVKHRNAHGKHGGRNSGQVAIPHHQVRTGIKSPTDPHMPGAQAMNIQTPIDVNQLKSQTSGFQANFAQSIAKKMNLDDAFDIKHSITQNQQIMDSPTMQLLTQQETIIPTQGEGATQAAPFIPSSTASADHHHLSPIKSHSGPISGRPCQFIIKKNKLDNTADSNTTGSSKIQVTNVQVIPPKSEIGGVKVLQNRHIVMASPNNSLPKVVNSGGKLVTAKFVQQLPPKSQSHLNSNISKTSPSNLSTDKVIIVSKPGSPTVQTNFLQRTLNRPKNIIISNQGTPIKEGEVGKIIEGDTQVKTTMQTPDSKMQPKTFLVNPKSGQKMVVLPAKARSKGSLIGQSVPLMQVKGLAGRQTPVKLVPLGSQVNSDNKSNNITIVSKPNSNILTKVISKESLTHINSSALEGSNVKPGHVQIAPKPKGQAIIRQTGPHTKSNLIVLQKSSTPNKSPITLSKNGNDLSKIIKSNKVNPTPPTSQSNNSITESDVADITKNTGNVIVLQLTNDQIDQPQNIGQFLQSDQSSAIKSGDHGIITEDTPVLFHSQLSDQVSNADSLESAAEALMDVVNLGTTSKTDAYEKQQCSEEKPSSDEVVEKQEAVGSNVVSEWNVNVSNNQKVQSGKMGLDIESDLEGYADSSQDGTKKDKDNLLNPDESIGVLREQHDRSIGNVSRTLLSQLQDDGSSSNDSSFLLSKSIAKTQNPLQSIIEKQSTRNQEADQQNQLNEEKTSTMNQEQANLESKQNRMDIFSTAIASADINLDSFEYLEDEMMSQDEILQLSSSDQSQTRHGEVVRQHKDKEQRTLEQELHQLMEEDHLDDASNLESSCPPSGAIE